ncbi:DUF6266 family protein [Pedobacter sp. GR22-6]|uniref:DUF6266 family protein n=1 Tax=Pedobacter sp. GR22-6 TaxID=3127957 RepID=UPI00307F23FF
MGIQKSGPFGGFYKKTGPIIGRRSRNQNVITALHHPSNKPSSEDQLVVQDRFTLLTEFLNELKLLINLGFKAYAKGRSALNAAFSYNYPHAFLSTESGLAINYPKMVYSRGKINWVSITQLSRNGQELNLTWSPDVQSDYCQFSDLGTLLVYNADIGKGMAYPNAMKRKDLGYVAVLPKGFESATLHCYLDFCSADGKLRGNSKYLGCINF